MGRAAHQQQPEHPKSAGPEPASVSTEETSPKSWQVTIVTGDMPDARSRLSRAIGIILAAAGRTRD
jgi:hypothetical protein